VATARQIALDAAVALSLCIALGVVYGFDSATRMPAPAPPPVVVVTPPEPPKEVAKPLRLAVTPRQYDDMGRLLSELGEGYKYTSIELEDLLNAKRLSDFDIVFLTCGTVPESWLGAFVQRGERGTELREWNESVRERLRTNLRQFVGQGGTLYASDWRFKILANCFQELVDPSSVAQGQAQTVHAEVVDSGLRDLLGSEISLTFDLGDWDSAAFSGSSVSVYLTGDFRASRGKKMKAPLLVKFPFEKGTVIFTSFHNEKQNSKTELALLRYLVFSAVTARVEAQITQTMLQGGFSPQKRNLLSASQGDQSVTQVYNCKKNGRLQFVLGFQSAVARMRLTIFAPDGRKVAEKEGTSTITVEVPDASPGDWKYAITAIEVPHENFPFNLTVGQQ
jgi:hypothetical protein